ncbi:MAG: hypothetical protein A2506_07185 [Elusimicrobia bacterium RIFOXYD12_FULL_66_9]|nr:MAG: hypothetical protein A2506_07185 [Elusimicrobia bacterium RIFOXYD12_FULL_66_9]
MRKLLSSLLVAALLTTSGSLPLWAQQIQAAGAAAGAAAHAVAIPGAARAIPSVGVPSAGVMPLAGLASPLAGLSALPSAPAAASAAVVSARAAAPAPAAKAVSPAERSEVPAAQGFPERAFGSLERSVRAVAASPVALRSPSAELGRVFDGSRIKDRAAASVAAPHRPAASTLHILRRSETSTATRAAAPSHKADAETEKKPLPRSYKLYLGGQILYALGQEASTLIAPLYAYFQQGLGFAVAAQFVDLVSIIPGSMLGDWLVRKFDSKKVYLGGIMIHAVAFLSVPAAFLLTGTFSPVHFIAFKIVSGLIYGALRGVAEKEIPSRILGQEDMERLKTAGSLFYAAFEVAELISALAVTALIAAMTLHGASLAMGLVMAASLIPNFFIRFREGSPSEETGGAGTEKKLPLRLYLPFVFSLLFHILLYGFFAPFFALEIFKSPALNATIIAFYTAGSLAVALLSSWRPQLTSKLSERGWSAAGIAASLAFFWATLALQIPALTMGLSFLMGVGLTEMQIQWRALYQKRLALEVQPKAFKWLMIWGILAAIIPAAILQAGVVLSMSMPLLLGLVGAGITLAALGVPLALRFLRRPRA